MMGKIVYIGFGELMGSLQSKLCTNLDMEFKEIQQLNFDTERRVLGDADVFLIGPYALEQVRQLQRATIQDPVISVIILAFPDQSAKVKQQIQFASNVSKYVQVIPYDLGKDITGVIEAGAMRTKQRKSFLKMQKEPLYPFSTSPALTFHHIGNFLENAAIGAIIFDQKKNVISANSKARSIFGALLRKTGEVNWKDLFPGEIYPETPDFKLIEEQGPIHETIKVNNQYLELDISPVRIEKKNKPDFLLLMVNVTQKVNVENQLKSKIDELEFLNRELDDFVNVVSHDFKTPLTSIGLLAEVALKEKSQETQLKHIRQIKQSSNKLRDLLKGLNTLVDIKNNRTDKLETITFQERLDFTLSEHLAILEETNGQITTDFHSAPDIHYFKPHIDSLFSNLITNSIKYRDHHRPLRIEVKSRREKEYTILSVKDNGIGINLAKNINKLFQPFKRLTDHGTGSGLGLSIVKRMVEKDHGYLEVYSNLGEGTEFKVYLKRH